ncbi:MAG: MmgE/PrpD family protein [Candidatus Actinomarinaceae bacterium]
MNITSFDNLIVDYLKRDIFLDEDTLFSVKLALLDTIGCIFNAASSSQPVSFASTGQHSKIDNPFELAKSITDSRDLGKFFTTLTRWYDYNDTFLAKEWAHPSDNIGTSLSYFMTNGGSFKQFSESILRSYEIQGSLSLGTSLNKEGYDHVFFVKMASGAIYANLLSKGNEEIIRRTVNNILLDGPTLRAYRHAPNVGKRKSWAAGDAVSRAIEISKISCLDDETYDGILKDSTWGFENIYFENTEMIFGKPLDNWVINNVLFKVLYPAEFHGQSAVEAAAQLAGEYQSKSNSVKEIVIETHEPAIRIISNKDVLMNSSDRDHSLEYMVAAALLFNDVTSEMYEESFHGYTDIEKLRKKITVIENPNFTKTYYEFEKREIANTIYLNFEDGTQSEKITIRYPIGHPKRRDEAIPLIREKFIKNTSEHFHKDKANKIWNSIVNFDMNADFSSFVNLLVDE